MDRTAAGRELRDELRSIGLDASEIRLVWKNLRGVPWADVEYEESRLSGPVTKGALNMRLQRLKGKYPYLREILPSRKRARR